MNENPSDSKEFLRNKPTEDVVDSVDPKEAESSDFPSKPIFKPFFASDAPASDNTLLNYPKETIISDSAFRRVNMDSMKTGSSEELEDELIASEPIKPVQKQQESDTTIDDILEDELDNSVFPLFLSFKANDSMERVSDAVREKNVIRGGNPANQSDETYVPSMLSKHTKPEPTATTPLPEKIVPTAPAQKIDKHVPEITPLQANKVDSVTPSPQASTQNAKETAASPVNSPVFIPVSPFKNNDNEPSYDIPDVFKENSTKKQPDQTEVKKNGWQFESPEELAYKTPFKSGSEEENHAKDERSNEQTDTVAPMAFPSPIFRPANSVSSSVPPVQKSSTAVVSNKNLTSTDTSTTARPGGISTPPVSQTGKSVPTVPNKSNPTSVKKPATASKITPPVHSDGKIPDKKKDSNSHKGLLVLLLTASVLVLLFCAWYFDLEKYIFGDNTSNANASASITVIVTEPVITQETTPAATPVPTSTPTASPTPTPTNSPTPTEVVTPSPSPAPVSAQIPSAFMTYITDAHSTGSTASFVVPFTNTGGNDVSLLDGIEYIWFDLSSAGTITQVTSDDFIFTLKDGTDSTFIGTPINTEVIEYEATRSVTFYLHTAGEDVGKFTISKYFIEYYG
jgi:hypothetical protein